MSGGTKMKNLHSKEKGMTLIKWLVVISIIGILIGLGLTAIRPIMSHSIRRSPQYVHVRNLISLHKMFMMYELQCKQGYPTTVPDKDRYKKSAGVRGLYPLYSSGVMKVDALNKLLHPPGTKLLDFSYNPTIDEFDKYHIGYAYNSTAKTNSPPDTPILSEQGVSDGVLNYKTKDKGTKPILKKGALVLFANGNVEYIKADKKGKLSTKKISAEMWKKLVD